MGILLNNPRFPGGPESCSSPGQASDLVQRVQVQISVLSRFRRTVSLILGPLETGATGQMPPSSARSQPAARRVAAVATDTPLFLRCEPKLREGHKRRVGPSLLSIDRVLAPALSPTRHGSPGVACEVVEVEAPDVPAAAVSRQRDDLCRVR